ncbi:MAG TPA: RDD family protein [Alphaproteobacteria bacterium]|nr:RDD family protein [Alphaproteobacteria bacterium]
MSSHQSLGEPSLLCRAGACLIDLAIVGLIGGVASRLLGEGLGAVGSGEELRELARKLALLALYSGYCVFLTAGPRRATWGQRWFGLQVLGAAGGRPSVGEACGRWLAFLAAALPLGVGLLIGLGPDRRPFQDRLCDSRLVFAAKAAERPAA